MPHVTLSAYPMIHYSQEMRPVFFLWCDQQDDGLCVWGCHTIKYTSWTIREKVSRFIEVVLRLKCKALKLFIKLLNKSPYVYFLKNGDVREEIDCRKSQLWMRMEDTYKLFIQKLASFLRRVHFKASWCEGCSKGLSSKIFCFWQIFKTALYILHPKMHCDTLVSFFSSNIVDKVGGYAIFTVMIEWNIIYNLNVVMHFKIL